MVINPVKGTHDIIGDEAAIYTGIESVCRAVAEVYNFQEIRTPVIEHTPLFLRSVGESSDIVTKEMYTFEDKGGRSITLRPELTAGVMRSIVSNKLYANADLPLKYFYIGQCFRYERPQAGRYRQFHQFGIEVVGATNYLQDVETIVFGKRVLEALSLDKVKVCINTLGDDASRNAYRDALRNYFAEHIDNMCPDCKRRLELNPLRILDCKVPEDRPIIEKAPKMSDFLTDEARVQFENIVDELKKLGVEVEIDETLVRGLDYYTGVVFEYKATEGDDVGAIGGGGHYKNLLHEVGGPELEGIGLAFGLERLFHVFSQAHGTDNLVLGPDFYLMGMNNLAIEANVMLADILRINGFSCDMNFEEKGFKSLFKIAERKKAKFAIIVGEDEMTKSQITVKNLKTQEQTSVKNDDMLRVLRTMLEEYLQEAQVAALEEDK